MLLSFHYYRDHDLDQLVAAFPTQPQVFADSGGFSAKSLGAEVKLDDYVAWLHRWQHLLTCYANLDVIGDAAATYDNQVAMEAQGLQPLPVFHGGEPWEYLDRYLGSHPYICLGGMVATGGAPAVLRWCVQAFVRARAAGAVYHGFGQTTLAILRALPWYSVDSSAWGAGHRYGTLNLWDDRRARWVRCALGRHDLLANAELVRAHGGDPRAMARPGFALAKGKDSAVYVAERAMVIGVNAAAWVRMEGWMRAHHGPVQPPPGAPPQVGPMLYLADGSADHLLTAATRLHQEALA